eukprot:TRINITY_DN55654_c0_g1_i1.p1 TRINITY_DN55654_c0_g1~~TRINITY_DN55654_c0_g1_i1.p1  ORF type:complete len:980 (+),score=325.82 TRINITY_DN55654_c0_g1_i1:61-2940(+)
MFSSWKKAMGQLPNDTFQASNAVSSEVPPTATALPTGPKGLQLLRKQVARVQMAQRLAAVAEKDAAIAATSREFRAKQETALATQALMEEHAAKAEGGVPEDLVQAGLNAGRLGALEDVPEDSAEAVRWAKALLENPASVTQLAKKHFRQADTNRSGFLDWSEAPALASRLCDSLSIPTPGEADLRSFFDSADRNHDQKLSSEEFVDFYRNFLQVILDDSPAVVPAGEDEAIQQMRQEMEEEVARMKLELELAKAEAAEARAAEAQAMANQSEELTQMQQLIRALEDERNGIEAAKAAEETRLQQLLVKEEEERKAKELELLALQAKLDAAQKGAQSAEELRSKLEEKNREHEVAMRAQQEEADRLLDMLTKEDELRQASEQSLDALRKELDKALQEGAAHANELQAQLEHANAEHAALISAQQEELNNQLEAERQRRVQELDALRLELSRAKQEGSTATAQLQAQLDERSAEHNAKLQVEQEARHKLLEEERQAAEKERLALREQLDDAIRLGEASSAELEARALELEKKEAEHQASLFAQQQEADRLRTRLNEEEQARQVSERELEKLRADLASARASGASNADALQKELDERSAMHKEQLQRQQDELSQQLENERQARLAEIESLRQALATARQQGSAQQEDLQRLLEEKEIEHKAKLQAQQESLAMQLEEVRRQEELERTKLKDQLAAAEQQARMSEQQREHLRAELEGKLRAKAAEYEADMKAQEAALQQELASAQAKLQEDLAQQQQKRAELAEQSAAVEAEKEQAMQKIEAKRRAEADQESARARSMLMQTAHVGASVVATWVPATGAMEYPATVAATDNSKGTITVDWADGGVSHRTMPVGHARKLMVENGETFAVRCIYAGVSRQVLCGQWDMAGQGVCSITIDGNGKVVLAMLNPPGGAVFIEKQPDRIILNLEPGQVQNFWTLDERTVTAEAVSWISNDGGNWIWTRI